MSVALRLSRWPKIRFVLAGQERERYDTVMIFSEQARLGDQDLRARAEEFSLPIAGFANDRRAYRIGYPNAYAKTSYIWKIKDPSRRERNPYEPSRQRDFAKKIAEKVKTSGRVTLLDARWLDLDPQWFDAFFSMLYEFNSYRSRTGHLEIDIIKKTDDWDAALQEMAKMYQWVYFARDLVNIPPGEKSPEDIGAFIIAALTKIPGISGELIAGDAIREFDLIWRVGKGCPEKPPALLKLEYNPIETLNKKPIVLIGKGVLYDQGGFVIKTDDTELPIMKLDCAGAMNMAAVCAIAAELKLPLKIICYLPFVMNLSSSKAGMPGDIGKLKDGTTVEITDTDAEGRLILIDTVCHSVLTDFPELIIDLGTLSGATEHSLGPPAAGVLTDTEWLWNLLEASAKSVEEHVAKIPPLRILFDDLRESRRTGLPADLRNFPPGKIEGDSIRSGCFILWPAMKKGIASAHIDICGPAFLKESLLWWPEGATGWGIRLLTEFLKRLAKEKAKNIEESVPQE